MTPLSFCTDDLNSFCGAKLFKSDEKYLNNIIKSYCADIGIFCPSLGLIKAFSCHNMYKWEEWSQYHMAKSATVLEVI